MKRDVLTHQLEDDLKKILLICVLMSSGLLFAQQRGAGDLTGTRAIGNNAASRGGGTLSTGFETFALGDIDTQEGWIGQFGNWTIDNENPHDGAQHINVLSDGFGQSLAFSPDVGIGGDSNSSMSCWVDYNGAGVTWQLIPQSPTDGSVVTRVQIDTAGNIACLVDDGGAVFMPTGESITPGYHQFMVQAERGSGLFTLAIDGAQVFSGQGFSGNVEQVVFLSLMEVGGPEMDIDDVEIVDGAVLFSVPTLGQYGFIAFMVLLAGAAIFVMRRKTA